MSAIRQDQLETASKFMSAFWNELVKPYYNPEQSDEYWLALIDTMNDLYERFDLLNNRELAEITNGFASGLEIKNGSTRVVSGIERLFRKVRGLE